MPNGRDGTTIVYEGTAVGERRGVADTQEELMRALHDQHAGALWSYALRLTAGDRSRSEDIVQETLLRAWRNPQVLERAASARAWLFTVARRIVIDEWRSGKARNEFPVADPSRDGGEVTPDGIDQMMLAFLVAEALDRLSEPHRQVVVECYYRGRSVAEAASVLAVPAGTVKSRLHYALRALRLSLQELGATQ